MPDTSGSRTVLAAETSPDWRTGGTARKGQQYQFGFNAALRKAADRAAYPIRIEVWLELHGPFRSTVNTAVDLDAVAAVEQTIQELAAGRAVLAGQVTMPGTRSFLVYTGDASLAQDLDAAIRARVLDHAVQLRAMPDQQWSGYASIVKMARRSRLGMAILAVFPLITLPILLPRYGAGWAIGEVLWLSSWIATLLIATYRGRKRKRSMHDVTAQRTRWLATHPAWALVFVGYILASLIFFLLSFWLRGIASPWISRLSRSGPDSRFRARCHCGSSCAAGSSSHRQPFDSAAHIGYLRGLAWTAGR
jgi:Family of unknown function (DUF695)